MKVLGNVTKGFVFVLSAPAGTGKTTLVRMLSEEFSCVVESVSCTTRPPRNGEVEGKDYYFLSQKEFEEKIHAGEFLEYAQVFGHYYGTSRRYVEEEQSKGKHVILVIDTQGAMQLKGRIPATFVFISPPSLVELERRLQMRKTESQEVIAQRLSWAKREMEIVANYDYHIINENLEIAYDVLRSILIAEEHRLHL